MEMEKIMGILRVFDNNIVSFLMFVVILKKIDSLFKYII